MTACFIPSASQYPDTKQYLHHGNDEVDQREVLRRDLNDVVEAGCHGARLAIRYGGHDAIDHVHGEHLRLQLKRTINQPEQSEQLP